MKKVGEHITSSDGTEYVITGVWEHLKWYDYDLRELKTGKVGQIREKKQTQ